jgi:dehydrogenase/reductase SDR family protein 7B
MKKVALITGGSSGIGLACALEFGHHGFAVAISGRNEASLQSALQQLKAEGVEAIAIQGDVGQEADCQRMADLTVGAFGRLDVLINNAGISMRALFVEAQLDVLKQVMNINFWGTVYCTKFALPHVLKSAGSIIGISSIAGHKGLPARTGYSASKFAMNGFLEAIRIELRKTNVHVLLVSPGFVATNIRKAALVADGSAQAETPRNENDMLSAEYTAQEIYKAYTGRKRDLVLGRQGKLTIWLNKFFPAWLDGMVYKHLAAEKDSPLK